MRKTLKLLAFAILGIAAVACSSAEKMAKMADQVQVTCNPGVLELVAGKADATVSVTYPDGYFHPKAILQVTPVLVYNGGEYALTPFMYQGEKVLDNYKVVPSAGGTVTERISIPYRKGMEKSYLELRGVVSYKNKSINLPVKKVADGMNTTYMLVDDAGRVAYKADGYQQIITQTEEGQILYTINSSDVRGNQINGQSIKAFQAALDEIRDNERKTLTGTEIVAYASPDGGEKLNDKLSSNRANSAEKAWNSITKGHDALDPDVKSIGQDWEGFQELVSKSDIEDKNLILRVLSMYSDPAVRENEIKNMSEIYKELKDGVLPELRRARFIANVEYQNYTADELKDLIDRNIDVLDESALLHAATLVSDLQKKVDIYNKAIQKFDSDKARFNKGVAYLAADDDAKAADAFAQVKTKDADLQNALGVIALHKGDLDAAVRNFTASGTPNAQYNLGVIDILRGQYASAVQRLGEASGCCFNPTLAYILNGQLDKAADRIKCDDARSNYLRAIIAARKGDATGVKTNIAKASEDPFFAERYQNDIEFAAFR